MPTSQNQIAVPALTESAALTALAASGQALTDDDRLDESELFEACPTDLVIAEQD